MRRITYAAESFVTSDAIADALIGFATALATSNSSDSISIPALDDKGNPSMVHLVVGPSSELISIPVDTSDSVGLVVGSTLEDLERRTAELRKTDSMAADPVATDAPHAYPLREDLPDIDNLTA